MTNKQPLGTTHLHWLAACLAVPLCMGMGNCDAGPFQGEQTDGCVVDGGVAAVGDSFPSQDGCNACTCDGGAIHCTTQLCEEPAGCAHGGSAYAVGETFPATDGCNACECTTGGVTCTTATCGGCTFGDRQYDAGDGFICSDGCNTCTCTDNGIVGTAALCPELARAQACDGPGGDEVAVSTMYLVDDALALGLSEDDGCAGRDYRLCYADEFVEGSPIGIRLWLEEAQATDESCEAAPTNELVFNVLPVAEHWRQAYGREDGAVELNIGDRSPLYSF